MASGIVGQSALSAATNTTVYTVPASTLATVSVSMTNIGNTEALVRLALASAATPTNSEFIEYDTVLAPKEVLERNGLVLQANERVVAYSDVASVSVTVYGYEE